MNARSAQTALIPSLATSAAIVMADSFKTDHTIEKGKGDNSLGKDPASTAIKHRPGDAAIHARFSASIKDIAPEKR